MTYTIIGYRPHLTAAARGMLNRLFGDYGETSFAVLLPMLPDGAMVEHDGKIHETTRGRLILAIGGEYLTTPPEPFEFSADDYLIALYECAELYAGIYWRSHGNTNPGGSPRPVYQANARGAEMAGKETGLFRRRLEFDHLGD